MAHKLPSTDTFADSAFDAVGERWTRPTLYWPTLLWSPGTTDPTSFFESLGSPEWGGLHNGYLRDAGVMAPMILPTGQGLGRQVVCFTLRTDQRDDTDVRLESTFVTVGGSPQYWMSGGGTDTWIGVGARLHAAAGTDFEAESRYSQALRAPSGYWLLMFITNGGTTGGDPFTGFYLLKVTGPATPGGASTATSLASVPYTLGTPPILAGETAKIRLRAINSGPDVVLTGYFFDPRPSVNAEVEVISFTDTSAPFTGAGHPAMLLTSEMDDDGAGVSDHQAVHGVSAFEVRDGAGALILRDEFKRTHANQMDEIGPDKFGTTGHVVTGAFTGDQAGKSMSGEIPDFKDRMIRHASSAHLDFDSDDGGFHVATDPASNPYVQAAAIDVEWDTGTSSARRAAVFARMSVASNADWTNIGSQNVRGYIVSVQVFLTTWTLRVHAHTPTEGWVVIASRLLNQSGDPVVMAVSTTYTLRIDIENRDGQNAATGNVHIIPTINGNKFQSNWTLVDGVDEEDDGSITDRRSDRLLAGSAIGFFVSSSSGENVFVHQFDRPAVTFDPDPSDQDSVSLGNEKDGASGTLVFNYEWPIKVRHIAYGEAIAYDSKHVHTHATATAQRRLWTVRSKAAKLSEIAALQAFFDSHEGVETPFNWTPPDGTSIVAFFPQGSLKHTKVSAADPHNVYEVEFQIMELVGP